LQEASISTVARRIGIFCPFHQNTSFPVKEKKEKHFPAISSSVNAGVPQIKKARHLNS
jgi:hypothetical protein